MEPTPLPVTDKIIEAMLATELDVTMWDREVLKELALAAANAYEQCLIEDIRRHSYTDVLRWINHVRNP